MRQRNRESITDSDPQDDLFFASSEDDGPDGDPLAADLLGTGLLGTDPRDGASGQDGMSRLESRRHNRDRRRRSVLGVIGVVFVLVVVVVVALIGVPLYHYFKPSDYAGQGSGSVIVTVHADDGASEIGSTLVADDVVASQRAFTDAASDNPRSRSIQPGSYRMRKHMSAKDAVTRLLEPSARVDADVVITEGATLFDVEQRLESAPCAASSATGTICGLGLSTQSVTTSLANVKALGLPPEFTAGGTPSSAEGFLYPATYPFDDTTTVASALQTMVGKFTDQVRSTDFTTRAKALKLSPYQELIIASMVQSEAKYPVDMAKVARVILNRLRLNMDLDVDATSIYGARVKGLDPAKILNDKLDSPYNTYKHAGLPPTPISNPGAEALQAASHPRTGNWIYYVNSSPDRLFFTNSDPAFEKAKRKCVANNWGCG